MRAAEEGNADPGVARGSAKLLGLVLFLSVVGTLPPASVYWDGLGFLEWARDDKLDYGHLLYLPLLSFARWFFPSWLTDSEVYGAKLLSTLAAGAVFVMLWTRFERRGLATSIALGLSLLVTTTPLFWGQAGRIEPSTLTMAALLASASAAERYGERRSLGRCLVLTGALLVALGFHVVSILALPWLAGLARGPAPRPPARHLFVPAGAAAAGLLLAAATDRLTALGAFFPYWLGFLPDASAASLGEHLVKARELALVALPWLLPAGAAALVVGLARRRPLPSLLLTAPYLAALLLLGKPQIALAVPVSVSLGLLAADALAGLDPRRAAWRIPRLALPALLAVQLWTGAVLALREAQTPDDKKVQAELLAGALPRGAIMIAGDVAHHVRWYTGAPVVALPNELHDAASRAAVGGRPLDPIAVVNGVALREARAFETVYLTSEALEFLEWRFGLDPSGLSLDPTGVVPVRGEPELYLVPFALGTPPQEPLQSRE